MDEGTILVYCCPLPSLWPPPPLPKLNVQYIQTVCGCGMGEGWVGVELWCRPYSAGVLHSLSDQIQNLQSLLHHPKQKWPVKTTLKGPEHEISGSRVFTQIRPVWVGNLGTKPKNPKLGRFRPQNCQFELFSAVGYNAKDLLTLGRLQHKKFLSAVSYNTKKNFSAVGCNAKKSTCMHLQNFITQN